MAVDWASIPAPDRIIPSLRTVSATKTAATAFSFAGGYKTAFSGTTPPMQTAITAFQLGTRIPTIYSRTTGKGKQTTEIVIGKKSSKVAAKDNHISGLKEMVQEK